jgi:O-acetyl-ADP-ribose deacetylase (regulator of RNase III)
MKIEAIQGDITKQQVDAIVNAANESLLGGGGVDGAIHKAAGPGLLEECRGLNGCPTGEARITDGYRLAAGQVIHTVGPVWQGGEAGEPDLLAACYRNSLALAESHELESIAFPAISTGAYGFPPEAAAQIAVDTVRSHQAGSVELVRFVCFDEATRDIYARLLDDSQASR